MRHSFLLGVIPCLVVAAALTSTREAHAGPYLGIDLDLGPETAPPLAPAKSTPRPTAKAKLAAKASPPTVVTVTAAELRARGVPPATVGYWLKTGVLWRTPVAGVYEETERSRERMVRYGAKEPA